MLRLQAQFDFWPPKHTHTYFCSVCQHQSCVCVCVSMFCASLLHSSSVHSCAGLWGDLVLNVNLGDWLFPTALSLPSIHINPSGLSELYSLIRRPGNWAASTAIPLPHSFEKTLKTATSSWRSANTARSRDINLGLLSECRNATMQQVRAALQWPILRVGGGEIFTFKDLLNL